MAITSTIVYCEDADLLDCYPRLADFSFRKRLYNIQINTATTNWHDTTVDAYYAQGNGVVKDLFQDGNKMGEIAYNGSISTTALDGAVSTSLVSFTVDSSTALAVDDIIKIDNEYMLITAKNSPTNIVVTRGLFGTSLMPHLNNALIYNVVDVSDSVTDATTSSSTGQFIFDTDLDLLIILGTEDMTTAIIEAGEDWSTVKLRFRKKASRLLESYLDSRMSREVLKNREGSYPEVIIHATALQTVLLILKAHDPANDVIEIMQDEYNEIIKGLREGSIVLPTAVTMDSSKGVIREVTVNNSSDLRPVELRGSYNGSGYELLKILIQTGHHGVIGTSKMTVYGKSSTSLKTDVLVDSETINGDYQHLGVGSLYIRWSGDDVATATTTIADQYEVELFSSAIDSTNSAIGSMRMTRR